jgi:CPSF A subunit region
MEIVFNYCIGPPSNGWYWLMLTTIRDGQTTITTELQGLPSYVKTIQTVGDRAFVGDMMQSIQIIRYDAASNRLVLIANDGAPRPIASQELLDFKFQYDCGGRQIR